MKKKIGSLCYWICILSVAVLFLAPFYISLVYSFKSPRETALTGLAFPSVFHWENYAKAIEVSSFFNAARNSLVVTLFSVILLLVVCSMASYIIARNSSKFYKAMYYVFLAALLLPFQVVMLPFYVNLKNLGLLNSLTGLILGVSGFQIAYNVFIYTGFIKTVPVQMEEAAFIDGAGRFRTFWQIIFPLLKPINSTALILNALSVWNEFTISMIVVQKTQVRTLPLTQFYFFGEHSVELNMAFAAFTLSMIPIILLYLVMQKYIIGGIMSGAVKG